VDPAQARSLLGVGPGTGPDELRAAYRRALRRTHPDLHGGDGGPTREVVAAYESLLLAVPPGPPAPVPPVPPVPPAGDADAPHVVVDGDTVAAELPAGDLFAMLEEVGHRLGDVAYVDRAAGLLEVVVTFAGYGACSVLLTLQGRAAGLTEAFCTVEPLAGGPSPPTDAVAELLGEALRAVAPPG
jgi:hypothetical protein